MKKDINSMSRKELIELVSELLGERGFKPSAMNRVNVCDVEVESNVESLDKCKRVVNNLIKTHKDFITFRNVKVRANEMGYFG